MAALLNNAPAFHDDYAVGMLNGAQAVRNNQRGAALHEALQGFLHQAFRFVV